MVINTRNTNKSSTTFALTLMSKCSDMNIEKLLYFPYLSLVTRLCVLEKRTFLFFKKRVVPSRTSKYLLLNAERHGCMK